MGMGKFECEADLRLPRPRSCRRELARDFQREGTGSYSSKRSADLGERESRRACGEFG